MDYFLDLVLDLSVGFRGDSIFELALWPVMINKKHLTYFRAGIGIQ
jgi:hypothetical protein